MVDFLERRRRPDRLRRHRRADRSSCSRTAWATAERPTVRRAAAGRLPGTGSPAVDLRGYGESSAGWPSYTRTDLAGDLLAAGPAPRRPGGAGRSLDRRRRRDDRRGPGAGAGHRGSSSWRRSPARRRSSLGELRVERATATACRAADGRPARQRGQWASTSTRLPRHQAADWDASCRASTPMLRRPGRMRHCRAMGGPLPPTPAQRSATSGAPLWSSRAPSTPTGPTPQAEGEAIVAAMPAGPGPAADDRRRRALPAHPVPRRDRRAVLPFLAGTSVPRAGLSTGAVVGRRRASPTRSGSAELTMAAAGRTAGGAPPRRSTSTSEPGRTARAPVGADHESVDRADPRGGAGPLRRRSDPRAHAGLARLRTGVSAPLRRGQPGTRAAGGASCGEAGRRHAGRAARVRLGGLRRHPRGTLPTCGRAWLRGAGSRERVPTAEKLDDSYELLIQTIVAGLRTPLPRPLAPVR